MRKRLLSFLLAFIIIASLMQTMNVSVAAATKIGDDGTTNWDFIMPVTHQKTVPEGYIGVYTAQDLDNIRDNPSGNYILMNDIDLSSCGNWIPIGRDYHSNFNFSGTFDGNGYVIENLTIDMMIISYASGFTGVGLFGWTNGGTIKNVGMIDSSITIKGSSTTLAFVGSIAGGSYSIITNCYNTGNVNSFSSHSSAGGIVGGTYVSIANCYNTGNVSITDLSFVSPTPEYPILGGIAGCYASSISNCYNTGNVSVTSYSTDSAAGGIAGGSSGYPCSITSSYNIGNISVSPSNIYAGGILGSWSDINYSPYIRNCYYLNNNSKAVGFGIGTLYNVKSLTDEEMRRQSSFEGFDFDEVWGIDEGQSYPYLQNLPNPFIGSTVKINVIATGGGSVSGGGIYNTGDLITLTAVPNAGYNFDGWYEDDVKIDGVGVIYRFIAISDRMIEARFIYDAPIITTLSGTLIEGVVGIPYTVTITADNTPTSFAISKGKLPDGLTFDNNGIISGIPTTIGTSHFSVIAANTFGESEPVVFSITINPALTFTDGKGSTIDTLSTDMLDTTLRYYNKSGDVENLILYVAIYSPDGKLIYLGSNAQKINVSQTTDFQVTLNLPENADGHFASGGYTANVFLWDGKTFIPMMEKYKFQ